MNSTINCKSFCFTKLNVAFLKFNFTFLKLNFAFLKLNFTFLKLNSVFYLLSLSFIEARLVSFSEDNNSQYIYASTHGKKR